MTFQVDGPLRFLLHPSVGFGVNACWRAVWKRVHAVPHDFPEEARPTVRIERTEHWLVPRVDGRVPQAWSQVSIPFGRIVTESIVIQKVPGSFQELSGPNFECFGGRRVIVDGEEIRAQFEPNGFFLGGDVVDGADMTLEFVPAIQRERTLFIEDQFKTFEAAGRFSCGR